MLFVVGHERTQVNAARINGLVQVRGPIAPGIEPTELTKNEVEKLSYHRAGGASGRKPETCFEISGGHCREWTSRVVAKACLALFFQVVQFVQESLDQV